MKKLWLFFAILFTFTLSMEAAYAKRLGSGKSMGKSYQTAPARQQDTASTPAGRDAAAAPQQQRQAASAAPGTNSRKGLMGGLLGGLLVGGLFAALFAGGAFEGLQFMDFLIIGLLAFVLFKLIKALRKPAPPQSAPQPAYAGAGAAPMPLPNLPVTRQEEAPTPRVSLFDTLNSGSTSREAQAPLRLPPDFNPEAFLAQATGHYRTLQQAWNDNNLDLIRDYATPALFSELKAERAALTHAPRTEILELNVELVRADHGLIQSDISLRFSGRYRDLQEGVEEPFTDIWHLERNHARSDAPWHLAGIESATA